MRRWKKPSCSSRSVTPRTWWRALSLLPGQPGYVATFKETQRIFAEQLPVAPLFQLTKIAATRKDICNFIMDPTANSEFWNIEEFDYGEGCE